MLQVRIVMPQVMGCSDLFFDDRRPAPDSLQKHQKTSQKDCQLIMLFFPTKKTSQKTLAVIWVAAGHGPSAPSTSPVSTELSGEAASHGQDQTLGDQVESAGDVTGDFPSAYFESTGYSNLVGGF